MAQRLVSSICVRTIGLLTVSLGGLTVAAAAQDGPQLAAAPSVQLIIDGRAAPVSDIYRVNAARTPSGFDVPRFVSLKFGKVNARTGPSRDHPVAYQYQRRGLPLVIVAETEMWRKVRDVHGDEAWVRKPALSGERHAITMAEIVLSAREDAGSRPVARLQQGSLVKLENCRDEAVCKVRTANGISGWAPREALWGAQRIDQN